MKRDIQLLRNHTILHARSAYGDWPEVERKRHLRRLWLSPAGPPVGKAKNHNPNDVVIVSPGRNSGG